MVNLLAGILVQDQVPIDATERDMIAELLGIFPPEKVGSMRYRRIVDRDAALASLNVVGQP